MNTTEQIDRLEPHQVFVFGSNLAGRHGAGAAKLARLKFGAVYGVGTGLTGKCYALPTKDGHFQTLSLAQIAQHVRYFMQYAEQNPHQQFMVTKIGCGLAGYTPAQIGPMFHPHPPNVVLPKEFEP